MSKKFSKKPLVAAIGTAAVTTLSFAPTANAEQNPFGMSDLSNGYLELAEADKKAEGSCGEGKCGDKMKKKAEASCGEGKCGEGKCAGKKPEKKAEGKCGEGKCGDKKADKAEGKCGEGKCGDKKGKAE